MKICPHCHFELKENAIACPNCGSDESTGWAEGAEYTHLELPDYEEIVENECGKKKLKPLNIAVALIIAIAFILGFIL